MARRASNSNPNNLVGETWVGVCLAVTQKWGKSVEFAVPQHRECLARQATVASGRFHARWQLSVTGVAAACEPGGLGQLCESLRRVFKVPETAA